MDRFLEMRAFAAVAEAGSFAKAADVLVTSKTAISRQVAELENRLGVRLLNRTTRRVSLTEEGERFHSRCRTLLSDVDEAETEISVRNVSAAGALRLSAPRSFGIRHLAPLWGEFLSLHPRVTLDVVLGERAVDLVEDGFDLAVRIAAQPEPGLTGRRLATTRLHACATPLYLDQHGLPRTPDDLPRHRLISHCHPAGGEDWVFDGPQGRAVLKLHPCMQANSAETCRAAALAHVGIALLPGYMVAEDLQSGRLIALLPGYRTPESGVYAVYPACKHVAPKVQALVDFLGGAFEQGQRVW